MNLKKTTINFSSYGGKLSDIIREHNIATQKSLGQHFLLNMDICKKIAEASGKLENFNIIEIGPGPGGLTRALLDAGAKKVFAVERDQRCVEALNDLATAADGRLKIEHANALDFDINKNVLPPRKIIANLPYNISTALLINWLEQINDINQMILMFQKEVAERIVASPGCKEYGRLSVRAQWLCKCELLFHLKPGAFWPPPKVTSSIVKLTPYPKPLFNAKSIFLDRVVSAGFGQRRKMLRSSLKKLGPSPENILEHARIEPKRRAETLTIKEWCALARAEEKTNKIIK